MTLEPDHPNVVIFPPLIPLSVLVVMLLLHWFWPLQISIQPAASALGAILCLVGIGCTVWGRVTLVKAKTNVSPLKPTTALATGGPFRFTRNPLYVGVSTLLLGLSLLIGTWWGIIVLAPAMFVLHYGVILREERYLEQKFGDSYVTFKRSVRRYL
jgi:protein-S-isoprenylcysteine O-methyltransferase Ste14